MKILRLDLRAFGPFSDVVLDLSGGQEGLHLILGPNEAGKSSALWALRQMLFGIDPRTNDNFRHEYAQLRVGGTLRNGHGGELAFLRLKRQRNTLKTPDETADLDDAEVAKLLGGLTPERYGSLFSLDHDTLVSGGREITAGKGSVGELIFGAGSDLRRLRELQKKLDEAAFRPVQGPRFGPSSQQKLSGAERRPRGDREGVAQERRMGGRKRPAVRIGSTQGGDRRPSPGTSSGRQPAPPHPAGSARSERTPGAAGRSRTPGRGPSPARGLRRESSLGQGRPPAGPEFSGILGSRNRPPLGRNRGPRAAQPPVAPPGPRRQLRATTRLPPFPGLRDPADRAGNEAAGSACSEGPSRPRSPDEPGPRRGPSPACRPERAHPRSRKLGPWDHDGLQ